MTIPPILGVEDQETQQSFEVVDNDPATAHELPKNDGILNEVRGITEDPIPIIVAEIHDEIRKILRLHHEIYDGIELATDQVQDKRIEFLEAGPEVTVADLFMEFALVFFLNKALGVVLLKAFRFAANRAQAVILINRKRKLQRLKEARQARDNKTKLQNLKNPLSSNEGPAQIDKKKLKEFFDLFRSDEMKDFAVGIIEVLTKASKGNESSNRNSIDESSFAPDTIGVQIKSLAQSYLRNVESYLLQVAADTEMLGSIALSDKFLMPDCFALLLEIHAALAGTQKTGEAKTVNAKRLAMLEFEKLIWALLVADEFFIIPPQDKLDPLAPQDNKGELLRLALKNETQKTNPPPRLVEYLNSRFFPNDKDLPQALPFLDSSRPFLALKKVKADFLKIASEENSINVISILFKKEEKTQPPPSTPTPAK